MMQEQIEIDLDEETRRRLITIIQEDLNHGEATDLMAIVLEGLTECDRIVINN